MSKLKQPVQLQTAFRDYVVDEILGEGGAGRVYGGRDDAGEPIAIKLLTQASADKRKRFKNEIAFLTRNKHPNIVTVTDHGMAATGGLNGPFYVMRRYSGNLRDRMRLGVAPSAVLSIFSQVLDGVEGAHLLGAVHRDLKPENVLHDEKTHSLAVADFGIASFTAAELATVVETGPAQRLANFQYAAPEQRVPGRPVTMTADIYALGLMLNELFTGSVPHGTDYRGIRSVDAEQGFLDDVVGQMLKQNPAERPQSIAEVKHLIQKYRSDAVSLQKLSQMAEAVVPVGTIDDPLAITPPKLIDVSWDGGQLRLQLDRPVTREWVDALHNMGNYTSVMGVDPQRFSFTGATATVSVPGHSAQQVIDYFKAWLPKATDMLRYRLEQRAERERREREELLRRQREAEEQRKVINQSLRV